MSSYTDNTEFLTKEYETTRAQLQTIKTDADKQKALAEYAQKWTNYVATLQQWVSNAEMSAQASRELLAEAKKERENMFGDKKKHIQIAEEHMARDNQILAEVQKPLTLANWQLQEFQRLATTITQ